MASFAFHDAKLTLLLKITKDSCLKFSKSGQWRLMYGIESNYAK